MRKQHQISLHPSQCMLCTGPVTPAVTRQRLRMLTVPPVPLAHSRVTAREVLKLLVEAAADGLQFSLAGLLRTLYFCSNVSQPLPELLSLLLQNSQVFCVLQPWARGRGKETVVMIILIQVRGILPLP